MAITKLIKSTTRRERWAKTLRSDGIIETTLTQWYVVAFDNMAQTPSDCFGASFGGVTIPFVGQLSGGVYCTKVEPTQTESPNVFEVQCDWTDSIPPRVVNQGGVKWGVDIAFDACEFTEEAEFDNDGFPIQNSAKEKFDPSITKTYYQEEITVSFNTTTVDEANIVLCRGKINNAPFSLSINGYTRTFDTMTMKLIKAPFQTSTNSGSQYFKVQYVFRYLPPIYFYGVKLSRWTTHVVDRGFHKLDANGKPQVIYDAFNQPVAAPVYLDGSGGKLVPGADPYYRHFSINDEQANFTPLFVGL